MREPVYHVLLLEDSAAIRERSKALLAGSRLAEFATQEAVTLASGLKMLAASPFDAVLLDLGLPDSGGLETVKAVRAASPKTAIIVLTADDSDGTVLDAIREGTQEYLLKHEITGPLLQRTLRYAIELKKLEEDLRRRADYDILTGLFTRRKIVEEAERSVTHAVRSGLPLTLAMADVDGLKRINDNFGHRLGDSVLEAFGKVVSAGIGDKAMAGRWGGDEFMLVFPGITLDEAAGRSLEIVSKFSSLQFESGGGERFSAACTFGLTGLDPASNCCPDLMRTADMALYEGKRRGEPVVIR